MANRKDYQLQVPRKKNPELLASRKTTRRPEGKSNLFLSVSLTENGYKFFLFFLLYFLHKPTMIFFSHSGWSGLLNQILLFFLVFLIRTIHRPLYLGNPNLIKIVIVYFMLNRKSCLGRIPQRELGIIKC